MTAAETLEQIRSSGVVGIVRSTDSELARTQAERVIAAGLPVVEVSLTTPDGLAVIEALACADHGALVGAGTVLDRHAAEAAISAGARLLVSPILDRGVIEVAVSHDVAVVPGCLTPTEAVEAIRLGATAAKLFPAHLWSPAALSGMLQALPDLPCIPTGGVGPDTAASWISAGAAAVGVGSALTAVDEPGPVVATLLAGIARARSEQ